MLMTTYSRDERYNYNYNMEYPKTGKTFSRRCSRLFNRRLKLQARKELLNSLYRSGARRRISRLPWTFNWRIRSTFESELADILPTTFRSFHYLFGVSWVTLHGKELLLTTWANRWQNETSLTICDYEKATCSLVTFLYLRNFPYPKYF